MAFRGRILRATGTPARYACCVPQAISGSAAAVIAEFCAFVKNKHRGSFATTKPIASFIEPLESRIAPAGVTIIGKTATWTDYDGDLVTMKWTGALAPNFQTVTPTQDVTGGVLISAASFNNANDAITVSVKAAPGGDGRVDLGYVDATNLALKSFTAPKASVMEFDCGDGTNAIGALQLGSYGTTNPGVFGTVGGTDGIGTLNGNVGTVKIAGDLEYGKLVVGKDSSTKVGSVTVGGSLKGDAVTGVYSGCLDVEGIAGAITILGTGGATNDGQLLADNTATSVTIGGDVIGGAMQQSGTVKILLHVNTITVNGSVVGGTGQHEGFVEVEGGDVGTLTVRGDVVGGSSFTTGGIECLGSAKVIAVGGSLIGGAVNISSAARTTGFIDVHFDAGKIAIGHNIETGSVTGGGSVQYNGAVLVGGNLGSLTVGGDILGSDSQRAFILAKGTPPAGGGNFNAIGKISVKGSVSFAVVESGQPSPFGSPNLGTAEQPDARIGSVSVGKNFYHSSIMAGINDMASAGVDPNDTASGTAVLGPISIGGAILDDASAGGDSGFEAHTIAKVIVAGHTRFLTGQAAPILDPDGYVLVREL